MQFSVLYSLSNELSVFQENVQSHRHNALFIGAAVSPQYVEHSVTEHPDCRVNGVRVTDAPAVS